MSIQERRSGDLTDSAPDHSSLTTEQDPQMNSPEPGEGDPLPQNTPEIVKSLPQPKETQGKTESIRLTPVDRGKLVEALAAVLDPEGFTEYKKQLAKEEEERQFWLDRQQAVDEYLKAHPDDPASQAHESKEKKTETGKKSGLLKFLPKVVKVLAAGVGAALALNTGRDSNADKKHSPIPPAVAGNGTLIDDNTQRAKELVKTVEASNPVDIYGPEVTRAWLEQNPQAISARIEVVDPSNNRLTQYVVIKQYYNPPYNSLWHSIIYESHKDPTSGVFTEYQPISRIPIEGVGSLVSNSDGSILIAAGESPIRSLQTAIAISYNFGKDWTTIPWPFYQYSGGTSDLLKVVEDSNNMTALGNNATFEQTGVGQYLVNLNKSTRTISIQTTNLTIQQVGINVGGARDLSLTSVTPDNHRVQLASNGSASLQYGILLYDIDYSTGEGSVENIVNVLIKEGQDYISTNLGWLYGRGTYTDSDGHLHFVSSNTDRSLLYDVDLTTRTGTKLDYTNFLDNRGIPNYLPGSFHVQSVNVIIDPQGNQHTWLGGAYTSTVDGSGRAVLYNLETGVFYDLEPNLPSGVYPMELKKINNQLGFELTIGIGKVFVPINSDGTPMPDKAVFFTDRGLGNPLPDSTPTPTSTPTPPTPTQTPTPILITSRVYLPQVSR